MKDINDIRCAFTSDNDNSNKQVIHRASRFIGASVYGETDV